jgi:hypothetical protein
MNFDLLHHLTGNHLNVLVIDFHPLQTVNILNFIHEIIRQGFNTHHLQECHAAQAHHPSNLSPLRTKSPSCNGQCVGLSGSDIHGSNVRHRLGSQSRGVLPCNPYQIQPDHLTSEIIAKSFGRRASNNSATRGRPPVISRVFDDSRGIRAIITRLHLAPFSP